MDGRKNMGKNWPPFLDKIFNILWLRQFSKNFHIQLAVITQTNPLKGYDFGIHGEVLEGQKTYYWEIKSCKNAGKIRRWTAGHSLNPGRWALKQECGLPPQHNEVKFELTHKGQFPYASTPK